MNALDNLKLPVKLAIPAVLLIAVSIGMVVLARSSLGTLDRNTQEIVEVSAERAIRIQQLAFAVDESTIRDKNIIIEADPDAQAQHSRQFQEDKRNALAAIDALIALAGATERRATNEGIKQLLNAYLASVETGIALGLKGDRAGATKVSDGPSRALRLKLIDVVNSRAAQELARHSEGLTREVATFLAEVKAA